MHINNEEKKFLFFMDIIDNYFVTVKIILKYIILNE